MAAWSNVRLEGLIASVSSAAAANSAYEPTDEPKTSSPGLEPRHAAANGLDLPRDVRSADRVSWLEQAVQRRGPRDVREAVHQRPVGRVDAGRTNPNQHIVVPDRGLLDLREAENLG